MALIPQEIEAHYLRTSESERLFNSARGQLERVRTEAILLRHLPPAPATIFDIGGAAGVYAFALARQGYRVHLIDPVELHLEQARERAGSSGIALASITRGDARSLQASSSCAEAVLLLGPLYHLVEYADRLQALREARRILKPGGLLIAAGVSRFASLIDGLTTGNFGDAKFRDIVADDLASGEHRNRTKDPNYFTTAYFHRPEELSAELREAGFHDVHIAAIEGPAWSTAYFCQAWDDPEQRERLLEFLALIEGEPSIQGASAHFVAIGRNRS